MKYCSQCGSPVSEKIPEDDNRLRHVCDQCNYIHYQNPKVVVGCLPVWEEQILLCRRAIHPRKGYWTLPGGFLENGETTIEGALRETMEEANARVEDESLYRLFDLPHISQIYMFYRAKLSDTNFSAGDESLEVQLFYEDDIPWTELAFPVVGVTLKDYFSDRKTGNFITRISDISFPKR